jgi:hypothetical protein
MEMNLQSSTYKWCQLRSDIDGSLAIREDLCTLQRDNFGI